MTKAVERMSRVDTAWLRMDTDANLMMIIGVWLLEPAITHEALCRRVEDSLLKYRRFRQKVVEDALGASWVEDDDFDVRRHVVRETLRRRRGQSPAQALQQRVGELAIQPLDPAHPLWQYHLIEDYNGGSAMIARIHHCIADGIALIAVTMSMVDGGKPPPRSARVVPDADEGHGDWLSDAVLRPLTDAAVKAIGLTGTGVARSVDLLAHPEHSVTGTLDLARSGVQVIGDAAAILLMADDSPTRLKGKPERGKRVAWCPPLPLADVKAVGRALGCSINDVLLATAAAAIGGYLRDHGDDTAGQEIRAMVPVNLRPLSEAHDLGNRFGLVPLVLPVGIANPVERVYEVRKRMRELKGSYQPLLAFAMLMVAGLLVKPAQAALLNYFARKATAVMTNVPGPAQPVKLCGATLKESMFWVPQSGDIGMGVSILSYAGGVQFGLITDAKLCPDPEAIVARFRPEFEKLLWLTLMLPWGEGEA